MSSTSRAIAFDRKRFLHLADWTAFGVAISLPWSTSATSILIALWLIAVLPTLTAPLIWREVRSLAGGLPVLLWLIAALGMLWADVPWHDRFAGLEGYNRFLTIPLLLAQFRRSDRGGLVLYGYLGSAVCLLITSWAFALIPAFSSYGNFYGVPVKNYILQTDEFLICGFALLGLASSCSHQARRVGWTAIGLGVLFLANLAFVFTSRTGLLVVPFLVAALGWRLSGIKGLVMACLIAALLSPILWLTSPRLRDFTLTSISDMRAYFTTNAATSGGLHVEYLRRSIEIIGKAPLVGHGTGSIARQFRDTAVGDSGAKSAISVNPHNQIFAVAIQIGSLGAVVLVAMWIAHFILFRGGSPAAAWIGMVVVIENVVSSAVNSHLFDFTQGWLYVFGVGIAGGMVLKRTVLAAPRQVPA